MTKADEEKEYQEALDFMNLDDDEVEKKKEIEAKKISSEGGELLRINNLALEYRYTLEGKELDEADGKWKQTGEALAGDEFIRITYSMLYSYADKSNLLSSKNQMDFYMQYKDSVKKQFVLVRKDRSISADNKSSVMKLFKDKLLNVGDIICNTKGNMESVVRGIEAKNKEDEDIF